MPEKSVLADLIVKLGADATDLTKGVEQGITALTGLSTSALAIGGAAATAIAAIGAAALAVGIEFDEAFDKIAVGTGATGTQLEGLQESFKNVFSTVPVDAGAAATAIADLATRTHLAGPPLEELATQVLNLSRITGTDVAKSVDVLTRAYGDWGIATENQVEANDFLFKTFQATGTGVDKLAQTIVQFGAPLRQLGFDFEEATALVGKWNAEGVNTEVVLSGMKIALGTFAEAGKPAAETLRNVIATIQDLGPSAEASGLAAAVFGKRAGPDMAAAILEGRFEIEDLVEALKTSETTINQTADATDDFAETWQALTNSVKTLIEPIGTLLVGALTKATAAIKAMVDGEIKMIEDTKTVVRTIGEFLGITKKAEASTTSLAKETKQQLNPALDETGKKMGTAKERAAELLTGLGKLKEKKKEVKDETKQLIETEQKFTEALIAMISQETIAEQKTFALAGQARDLAAAFAGVPQPIVDVGTAMNGAIGSATDLNRILDQQVTAITNQKVPLDNLTTSMNALGIESQDLKDQKLAGLKTALGDIEQAYRDGKVSLADYQAAQDAYSRAITKTGGAKESTDLFKGSLQQVSTVITDLAANLIGSFSNALNTGIKPIDDMKDAVLRLVSEQVLGLLSKHLTGLIELVPGLGKVRDSLSGIFNAAGGAASAGGGIAGQAGGVAGAGGGLGGAASGAGSGLAGTLTAIGAIGSLVTGVISNFQNARQETTLNAIEENTRRGTLYLGDRSDQGILGVLFRILETVEFGTIVKVSEEIRNHTVIQTSVLEQIRNLMSGGLMVSVGGGQGGGPASTRGLGPDSSTAAQQLDLTFDILAHEWGAWAESIPPPPPPETLEEIGIVTLEWETFAGSIPPPPPNAIADIGATADTWKDWAGELPPAPLPTIEEINRKADDWGTWAGELPPPPPDVIVAAEEFFGSMEQMFLGLQSFSDDILSQFAPPGAPGGANANNIDPGRTPVRPTGPGTGFAGDVSTSPLGKGIPASLPAITTSSQFSQPANALAGVGDLGSKLDIIANNTKATNKLLGDLGVTVGVGGYGVDQLMTDVRLNRNGVTALIREKVR